MTTPVLNLAGLQSPGAPAGSGAVAPDSLAGFEALLAVFFGEPDSGPVVAPTAKTVASSAAEPALVLAPGARPDGPPLEPEAGAPNGADAQGAIQDLLTVGGEPTSPPAADPALQTA